MPGGVLWFEVRGGVAGAVSDGDEPGTGDEPVGTGDEPVGDRFGEPPQASTPFSPSYSGSCPLTSGVTVACRVPVVSAAAAGSGAAVG